MIAHPGQIADAPTADQHDAVLLQVVALAGDIRDDLALVGQADLGDLAQRRVRLLRGRGIDARADAALLRVGFHGRNLGLDLLRHAALADQLVDRRHWKTSPKVGRCRLAKVKVIAVALSVIPAKAGTQPRRKRPAGPP